MESGLVDRNNHFNMKKFIVLFKEPDGRKVEHDDNDKLVRISRSLTDFYYCCYLSALAV